MALIVQTCGVVGTLLAATIAVRSYVNSNKRAEEARARELETRQTQLFMDIYKTWVSKEFQKDNNDMLYIWEYDHLEDFMSKYGERSNPKDHSIWDQNSMWLEGIGVLVKQGLVNPSLLIEMQSFTGNTLMTWKKFEPFVLEYREKNHALEYMRNFEYLFDVLKGKYEERYPSSVLHSMLVGDNLRNFLRAKPK
jgi:hypothetical protein